MSTKVEHESWRAIIVRLWPYLRAHRAGLAGGFATLLGVTLLRLLEPWPLKIVFDRVLGLARGAGASSFDPIPAGANPIAILVGACLAALALTALRAAAQYANQVSFSNIGNRVLTRLRADLFQHVQRLHLGFHRQARGGDLLLRVIQDVNQLRDVAVSAALPIAASTLVLAGMWLVMALMNWKLALLAAAVLPVLALRTRRLSGKIREASRKERKRQGTLAATAAESIGSIQEVQALSLESSFEEAFARENSASGGDDVKSTKLSAHLSRTVDLLLGFATALVLGYGSLLVLRAELTPGDLLVFLTYLRRAFNPAQDFAKYTGRMAKAAAAAERIFDILDRAPEVRDRADADEAPRFAGAIVLRDVTFGYEPARDVLRGFELAIPAGQRLALVGSSGAGKSTVLRLLLRFYDPRRGSVTIDGRDLREFTLGSLRRRIATVQQEPLLFVATIADNIALGAPGGAATRSAIARAAAIADADRFVSALPKGYETELGERGVTLSGGERQRIAVARAAIRDAPVVILDEPTTGLDEESRVAVLAALERLTRGRTTIIVSHDLELARRADRIVFLEEGRIIEDGAHDELVRRGGRYATLFKLQSEGV